MTIYDLIDKILSMPDNWVQINTQKFVTDNQDVLFHFIYEQWIIGENEDGRAVGKYKGITEQYYAKNNPPLLPKKEGESYNLVWSGHLFKELYLESNFNEKEIYLLIDSKSQNKKDLFIQIKREKLVSDPESIFGLNKKHSDLLYQFIEDNIIEDFKELLNLN